MTAATMKMIEHGVFGVPQQEPGRDDPHPARKKTIVGIWKMRPKPSSIFTYSENASSIFGHELHVVGFRS